MPCNLQSKPSTRLSNAQEPLKDYAYHQPRDSENRGKRQLSLKATVELELWGIKTSPLRTGDVPYGSQGSSRPGEISFWGNFATPVRRKAFRLRRLSESLQL